MGVERVENRESRENGSRESRGDMRIEEHRE